MMPSRTASAMVLTFGLTTALLASEGVYESTTCSYRFEYPKGWSVREDHGPDRVVVTSERVAGVEMRILADKKTTPLTAADADRFRVKVEETLKRKCSKVDQPPAPPNLLGRIGQYTVTFIYEQPEEGGRQMSIIALFAPKRVEPLYWYRIQLKVGPAGNDAAKEILSRVLTSFKFLVPPPQSIDVERVLGLSEFRHCYAVQKEIAVALSNLWISEGDLPQQLDAKVLEDLKKRKLLREVPRDPGQAAGSGGDFFIDATDRIVACRVHGSADGTVAGRKECPPCDEWEPMRVANVSASDFDRCATNRRSLAQAISRYAASKGSPPKELTPAFLRELAKGGFLGKIPEDPGGGAKGSAAYYLMEGGKEVGCVLHGRALPDAPGPKR